jgi:putative tricarboxylic transport membrane protein
MILSRGSFDVFVTRPISATLIALMVLLVAGQLFFTLRGIRAGRRADRALAMAGEEPAQRV